MPILIKVSVIWINKLVFIQNLTIMICTFKKYSVTLRKTKKNMETIIGRKREIAELRRHLESGHAEFIAVYGRRRVGKTFLINEVFRDCMVFHHTGLSPYDRSRKSSLKDQLQNFYFSLIRNGMDGVKRPKSWMEAFFCLSSSLIVRRMAQGRSCSLMNCHGWIRRAPVSLPLWRPSGMDGVTCNTISAL